MDNPQPSLVRIPSRYIGEGSETLRGWVGDHSLKSSHRINSKPKGETRLMVKRNSCKGRVVFVAPDGTSFHPCPHSSFVERIGGGTTVYTDRKRCLLPQHNCSEADAGRFMEIDARGEVARRTGRASV